MLNEKVNDSLTLFHSTLFLKNLETGFLFRGIKKKVTLMKKSLGDPIIINGRQLSLSRAIQAGDYIFCTGQVPMKDGNVMTTGSIEYQTRLVIEEIKKTLALANCKLDDVVKSMVWLKEKEDFPGFNDVYSEYFKSIPPARSAVVNDLLVDVRIEIEVIAYKPQKDLQA